MGKYTKLKDSLVKFSNEPSYQALIDKAKELYISLSRKGWCIQYASLKHQKDIAEENLKEINLKLEALNQLLVDDLEGDGEAKVTMAGLGTFSIKDSPYPQVKDKALLRAWVIDSGMSEILTVNYQTLAGMVKAQLEAGETLPDGVEVFMKSTIAFYAIRE